MPLGENPNLSTFWDPIVEKIEKKFISWRYFYISKGGRLTLTKAILSNLPTYFLSTFKAPMNFLQKYRKTYEKFSMGGTGENWRDPPC